MYNPFCFQSNEELHCPSKLQSIVRTRLYCRTCSEGHKCSGIRRGDFRLTGKRTAGIVHTLL